MINDTVCSILKRFHIPDSSPNTTAAILSVLLLILVLGLWGNVGSRITWLKLFAIISVAPLIVLTQSRSTGLALVGTSLIIIFGYRKISGHVRDGLILLGIGGLVLGYCIWAGRGTPESLGQGVNIRLKLHTAALSRLFEAFFGDTDRLDGLATDAALRYGLEIGTEQADIITNPLSSFLITLNEGDLVALAIVGIWLMPVVLFLRNGISPHVTSHRLSDLTFPCLCFLWLFCCLFNDFHQDRIGQIVHVIILLSSGIWAVARLSARPSLIWVLGAPSLLLMAGLLAVSSYVHSKIARSTGVDNWSIETNNAGMVVVRKKGAEPPAGYLVMFNYRNNTSLSWSSRQAAWGMVGYGWCVIEVAGPRFPPELIKKCSSYPTVIVGNCGPIPSEFTKSIRPLATVAIDPDELQLYFNDAPPPASNPMLWVLPKGSKFPRHGQDAIVELPSSTTQYRTHIAQILLELMAAK